MADRTYKVLAEGRLDGEDGRPVFVDLGVHAGHDAKAAIEAALAENGRVGDADICVGIPTSNWNEHDVEPDPRPQFKVTPRKPAAPEGGASE